MEVKEQKIHSRVHLECKTKERRVGAGLESDVAAGDHLSNDGLHERLHAAKLGESACLEHIPHFRDTRHQRGAELLRESNEETIMTAGEHDDDDA